MEKPGLQLNTIEGRPNSALTGSHAAAGRRTTVPHASAVQRFEG
jgi:hypothetical protein